MKSKFLKAFLLSLFIIFIMGAVAAYYLFVRYSPDKQYDRAVRDLFIGELSGDSLSLHYILKNPKAFGIDSSWVTLPYYEKNAYLQTIIDLENEIGRFSSIDKDKLSGERAYEAKNIGQFLSYRLGTRRFPYYDEPLSPGGGILTQLPLLLADYSFDDKQDVLNYLKLLKCVDAYLEGIENYERDKYDRGLFMADATAKAVIEQCDTVMDKRLLAKQAHFLHITFEKRLNALLENGLISQAENRAFIVSNDRLLTTVVRPAYERLGDTLTLLRGEHDALLGLYYLPDGKAYYRALFKQTTGSALRVEEAKTLLTDALKVKMAQSRRASDSISKLIGTAVASGDSENILRELSSSMAVFPMSLPEDMIRDLRGRIEDNFPILPKIPSERGLDITICYIDKSLSPYLSPAFYFTPRIDDLAKNMIYINPNNNLTGLELYTTLAHEGFPGHLYQSVYFGIFNNQNGHPIRALLNYGGYSEGWAYYVENLSYEYAKELRKNDKNAELVAEYYELLKLDRDIRINLFCLLDIAIHDEGMTLEEAEVFLGAYGVTDKNSVKNVYTYIVQEPCTYLKYYLGYLEVLRCKQMAKQLGQDAYSDLKFHTFMLENGPAPFELIMERLAVRFDP